MGRSWISDRESIQRHFALVYPVPMDSQDHFRTIMNHSIALPSKNDSLNTRQSNEMLFGCVSEIVMLVLFTVIVVYV